MVSASLFPEGCAAEPAADGASFLMDGAAFAPGSLGPATGASSPSAPARLARRLGGPARGLFPLR